MKKYQVLKHSTNNSHHGLLLSQPLAVQHLHLCRTKPSAAPTNAEPCVPIEFGIIFDEYPDEFGWMLVEGSEYDPNNDNPNAYVVVWESKYYLLLLRRGTVRP